MSARSQEGSGELPSPARVLFAGGGTGGHVYMAVALRQVLEQRDPGCSVLFVGTEQGLESRILPPRNFPLQTIRIGGLNRVDRVRRVRSLAQLPGSLLQSLRILRRFRPCVVVGLGGYSSGPVMVAALLTGCPSLLIEPNIYPGFTNRVLARWVARAAVAFEETTRFFGSKAVLTGIPIRAEFHHVPAWEPSTRPLRVLIFGGSRGSRPINRIVCDALTSLPRGLRLTHQTGRDDVEWVRRRYQEAGVQARVVEYLEDMPLEFTNADLVISRAGASTVAEITAAGRASILIPLPTAADDHQHKNARSLEQGGAALVKEQARLEGEELARLLTQLNGDRSRVERMAGAARHLARPDSARRITDLVQGLCQ